MSAAYSTIVPERGHADDVTAHKKHNRKHVSVLRYRFMSHFHKIKMMLPLDFTSVTSSAYALCIFAHFLNQDGNCLFNFYMFVVTTAAGEQGVYIY